MSSEQIDLPLTIAHPRTRVARFDGVTKLLHWWTANAAGHRRMVESAGFEIERSSRLAVPIGPAHPPNKRRLAALRTAAVRRAATGGDGLPTIARLARVDPSVVTESP